MCFGLNLRMMALLFMPLLLANNAYAQRVVLFSPREAKIEGSIPYAVIGKYKAEFKVFKGEIDLDQNLQRIRSVVLDIKVNSITSNSPRCDHIIRSGRLLNSKRYPDIVFHSDKIIHDDEGFKVQGVLGMHGIKKRLIFPFKVAITHDLLDIQGSWIINRKDFHIIWNRYLDHGGVLVGDDLTVNWVIKVPIN